MIATLISTLLGGILALAGTLVGPLLQRKHERWKAGREDRQLLREKAQELFDELDRVTIGSREASAAAFASLNDKSVELKAVPDLGRIRAIAAIYFPSSLSLIEKYESEHVAMATKIMKSIDDAVSAGDKGLGTLKALPMLLTAPYQEFASRFAKEMREHLAVHVPKIEMDE